VLKTPLLSTAPRKFVTTTFGTIRCHPEPAKRGEGSPHSLRECRQPRGVLRRPCGFQEI
jgi:hypothetical protein